MYNKRTIVLKEYDNRFSNGGNISGVLTLLCDGKETKCRLDVYNVDVRRYGEFLFKVRGKNAHSVFVEKLRAFTFTLQECSIDRVSAVLIKIEDKPYLIAHGSNYLLNADTALALTAGPERKNVLMEKVSAKESNTQTAQYGGIESPSIQGESPPQDDKPDEDITKYEQFVLASENYYENTKTDKGILGEYLSDMEKYLLTGTGEYFDSVRTHLTALFDFYPPYLRLMQLIDNSIWVKIERAHNRYFCLGLVKTKVQDYICYALPKRNAPYNLTDYHIIFQNASNGKLSTRRI